MVVVEVEFVLVVLVLVGGGGGKMFISADSFSGTASSWPMSSMP